MMADSVLLAVRQMSEEEARSQMSSRFGLSDEPLNQAVSGLNIMKEVIDELLSYRKGSCYECVVTINHYWRDDRNYWDTATTENVLAYAKDLNSLYIQLGILKTQETTPDDRCDHYTDVEFGVIRHLIIISEEDVHENRVANTPAMQKLQYQHEEQICAKEAAIAATEAATTAKELAELARLKEKYGQ
jgi:hypothetical protein